MQLLSNWFRSDPLREAFDLYDPLALAVVLRPMLTSTRCLMLRVDTLEYSGMGQTKVIAQDGAVALAKEVDVQGFWELLQDIFQLIQRPTHPL